MLGNVLEGPAVVAETATEEDVVRAVDPALVHPNEDGATVKAKAAHQDPNLAHLNEDAATAAHQGDVHNQMKTKSRGPTPNLPIKVSLVVAAKARRELLRKEVPVQTRVKIRIEMRVMILKRKLLEKKLISQRLAKRNRNPAVPHLHRMTRKIMLMMTVLNKCCYIQRSQ